MFQRKDAPFPKASGWSMSGMIDSLFDVMIHVHFIKLVIGILVRVVLAAHQHRVSNRFLARMLLVNIEFWMGTGQSSNDQGGIFVYLSCM